MEKLLLDKEVASPLAPILVLIKTLIVVSKVVCNST
jgi:hypothetical protein